MSPLRGRCQRRLNLDPLAAGEIDPPRRVWCCSFGVVGGHPPEVAVFESVAVAFQRDDFGVVDEAVDHGGGDGVVAEGLTPSAERFVAW